MIRAMGDSELGSAVTLKEESELHTLCNLCCSHILNLMMTSSKRTLNSFTVMKFSAIKISKKYSLEELISLYTGR